MNPTRAPVELLENIFGYVDDENTLHNLAITCKLFNALITPHLYQQVPMVDDDPRKIRDEPIIQTLNTRLTKLLEYLTPEKAQYVKLLALDLTTAGKELDIFSHFNNLETLVLFIPPDLPFRGLDPIKLHPRFLSVTNLAFRIVATQNGYYNYSGDGIEQGPDHYLSRIWGESPDGPYPSDVHLILDTSLGSLYFEEEFNELRNLVCYASINRVHTNHVPSDYENLLKEDDPAVGFDETEIRSEIHYYPSSYWNLGRATTKLWEPPEFRNESYKVRFFGAIQSMSDLEQRWDGDTPPPLPPGHLAPRGWEREGPLQYFHGTHIIVSEVFAHNLPRIYWPTTVEDAIKIVPQIDGQTLLLHVNEPRLRPKVLDPELRRMYLEINDLILWSEEGQPPDYDQIDEKRKAILRTMFLRFGRELYVNTCPEIYAASEYERPDHDWYVSDDDEPTLITVASSVQWTVLYYFLASLANKIPNWNLQAIKNLGPIHNLSRGPEAVGQLPPNSFDHFIDARCFRPLYVLPSITEIDFDMEYFSLDPSSSFGGSIVDGITYGPEIAQITWIRNCRNLRVLILRNLAATLQTDNSFLFRFPRTFSGLSWTCSGTINFSSETFVNLFGMVSIEGITVQELYWKWLDGMRSNSRELKLNFIRVKPVLVHADEM